MKDMPNRALRRILLPALCLCLLMLSACAGEQKPAASEGKETPAYATAPEQAQTEPASAEESAPSAATQTEEKQAETVPEKEPEAAANEQAVKCGQDPAPAAPAPAPEQTAEPEVKPEVNSNVNGSDNQDTGRIELPPAVLSPAEPAASGESCAPNDIVRVTIAPALTDDSMTVEEQQDRLIEQIEETIGHELDVKWRFTNNANAISVNVTYHEMLLIRQMPEVKSATVETINELTDGGNQTAGSAGMGTAVIRPGDRTVSE